MIRPQELILAGFFIIIPLAAIVLGYLLRRLQTQERLRAIEKGVPVPSFLGQALGDPWERSARIRRIGIALVAGGLGMLVFFLAHVAVDDRPARMVPAAAFSAIPIFIGLGLLYDYRLRVRDLKDRQSPREPGEGA